MVVCSANEYLELRKLQLVVSVTALKVYVSMYVFYVATENAGTLFNGL